MLLPLTIANIKLIYRNRQALFWALFFPLIFVTVFGVFRLDDPPSVDLLVVDRAQDPLSRRLLESLEAVEGFHLQEREDEAAARREVQEGEASYLLLVPEGLAAQTAQGAAAQVLLLYDRSNQTAPMIIGMVQRFVEEANRQLTGAPTLLGLRAEGVQARRLTYFDFLLPGFVGMGVMNFSIIGIASVVALYREQKILKRILATPLRVRDFFAGMVLAHLLLALAQAAIILAMGVLLFDAHVYGSYVSIGLVVILANVVFLNLGFIIGAIGRTVSAATGLGNAVALPMMFFSGVFFPTDNLPRVLATLVEYLPLAPMLDAMRGVALEARPLWEFPLELALLGAWAVVSAVAAVRVFRFE